MEVEDLQDNKYEKLFSMNPAAIFLARLPGAQIIEVNNSFLNIIEYTREEIIGRTCAEAGWLNVPELQKMIDTFFANGGQVIDYEIAITTKSGKQKIAHYSATAIDLDGEKCALGTVKDITDWKKTERNFKESEEKFTKLYNISRVGISINHLPNGEIMEINDTYLAMIGYNRAEVVGKKAAEVGWLDADACGKMLAAFSVNYTLDNYEIAFNTKSGQHGIALFSGVAVELNGEKCGLLTVQDITERKKAEEKLREMVGQLKQANRDLESFSFSVSHDLRAPLRAVSGYIQMLQHKHRESVSEDEEQLINQIKDQTRRMGNLIEDILSFSRQSNSELTKAAVDMTALAKDVLDDYANDLTGKEIILKKLLPGFGDIHALKQVFVNFITNALKYSSKKEHPIIEIGSYAEGNENIFFVKDNGAGFDMKYYNQLFQVFHRLHTPQEFEGNGVGLAIVNKIVTKHGGRVWAEGKVDKGATFYFSLPHE